MVPFFRPAAPRALAVSGLFALGLLACQGPDEFFRNGISPGTGGSTASTGGSGAGNSGYGGSGPGTGGLITTGGTTGTGGLVATGGVKGTGGVTGGGGRATGGVTGLAGTTGGGGLRATGGAGGAAGTRGAGGTGAGGATMATCTGSKLCIQTNCQAPSTSTIGFQLDILNNSSTAVSLSDVTVRYWFTLGETTDAPVVSIDYWMYDKSNISTKFVPVSPAVSGANEYFEVGFKTAAPMLPLFTDSTNIQFRLYTGNYNAMFDPTPTADYSFQKCGPGMSANQTSVNPAPTVTGYIKGTLAWGTEPM